MNSLKLFLLLLFLLTTYSIEQEDSDEITL